MTKLNKLKKILSSSFIIFFMFFSLSYKANAFPIFASTLYKFPRENNGRIVCANCHLAQKPTEIEVPSSILPDKIFEAIVKIPYDKNQQQLLSSGQKGNLNVGAIMILPEGFKLAPKEKLNEEQKQKLKELYITPYNSSEENILMVGPISGDKHPEISFPILAPNPENNKKVFYAKYPIYVGANRGRGQIYPTGEKSNNNPITSFYNGTISTITKTEKGYNLVILTKDNKEESQTISSSYKLIVKENQKIAQDEALTENPNVGGFGQTEKEIVLQNPLRIYAYLAFSLIIIITQSIFVFKKKQFEKVQLAELDF